MAADSDANGYLREKSEAEQAYLFAATFENLDTDKNDKVFLDEDIAYFQVRFDAARSRIVLSINEQGRTLFDILDTDRDRRLSFREVQAAASKLSLWDKDGDGLLSQSEVPQQYRLTVARGNLPALGGNFINLGTNQAGAPAERTTGSAVWFPGIGQKTAFDSEKCRSASSSVKPQRLRSSIAIMMDSST